MSTTKTENINRVKQDRLFHFINYILLALIALLITYPLYFIIIASFSDPVEVWIGKVVFLPKKLTTLGYDLILKDKSIWTGYRNTIIYALMQAAITVSLVMSGGYFLTRKELPGQKWVVLFLVIPMFFGGGLIPTFLWVRQMGLFNTVWAILLPGVGTYSILVSRTVMQSNIPDEMRAAALIDGCNDIRFFFMFVIPLSPALIAVNFLWAIVGQWNSYFTEMIYLTDPNKWPLQLILRQILLRSANFMDAMEDSPNLTQQFRAIEAMKLSVIIISTAPMLFFYPFLQKYFVKGIMVGSIKG